MARKVTGESEGEMMRKAAVYGTAVVVLATVTHLRNAVSHVGQEVVLLEA
jgi:hypothetical protein